MIIKSKPLPPRTFRFLTWLLAGFFNRLCNKIIIDDVPIKPGHSYLLMCNHFSFWDGFWAGYLCKKVFFKKDGMQRLYIMSVKKQMEKNTWLRYMGSFSVDPGKRSITESFEYAAEMLSQPGNLLMFFPQGNLESIYVREMQFDEGLYEIVTRIKGNCQLIWCSNFIEYFESIFPTTYASMLDCGTNNDFDFETLKQKVNEHHRASMEKNVRYTINPFK